MLAELLFKVVPMWCEKLERYIKEAEDAKKTTSGLIISPSGVRVDKDDTPLKTSTPGINGEAASEESATCTDKGKATKNGTPHLGKSFAGLHGICRLDAKPQGSKSRFSSLTGPVVMYDGESQRMLNDLWTSLNNQRGGLRREMMAAKRRQELVLPRMTPNIAVESETDVDGNSSTGKDEEDDLEHSNEMLRLRLKIEREKIKRMNRRAGGVGGAPVGETSLGAFSFKRARTMHIAGPSMSTAQPVGSDPSGIDNQRLKALLEGIDDNLDKACKVTETVAFVWLKGDLYEEHLKLIVGRLKDTAAKIKASGFVSPKTEEAASSAPIARGSGSDSNAMPPPPTSSCPKLSRKKSDSTMRDTCAVSLVAASTVKAERVVHAHAMMSIPPSIEVGSVKDEITPAFLADMLVTGKAAEESHKPSQPRENPLDPEVIEVEDEDDEGIVC